MNVAFWLRYITRSLKRSGRRALFGLVCIVVGVASVVALQTATLTVKTALTSNVRSANGGDISVASQASPLGQSDLAVFRNLQRQGKISAWSAVYSIHATAVGTSHRLAPFEVNIVGPTYPLGGQPTFVTPSNGTVQRLIQRPGDVLVTSVLAEIMGVKVGSRVFVSSIGGHGLHATIRGILAETSFEHSSVMTVNAHDGALLSRGSPHYSAIYANVPGDSTAVANTLRADFPVATVQTVREAMQSAQAQVHDFQQFMLLVGLMALLIAGIGILNAMQSILAWRRLEIAMLKAMGFGEGTLYVLFGGEAMLMGAIGGLGGAILGAAVSKFITDALARAMAIQVSFQLDPGTLLGGVALGLVATLIFSVMPIARAAAYRPLEILREGGGTPRGAWLQTLGLLLLVLVLFATLAAAIMGDVVLAAEFVAITGGACLILTGGFSLLVGWVGRLGPPRQRVLGYISLGILVALSVWSAVRGFPLTALFILAALVWAVMVLLPASGRLPLVMAVRALSRRRARTSVTLVAFLVGVLCMSVTLTVALSLQSQINNALASTSSTNLVALTPPSRQAALLRVANRLPGVQSRSVLVVASISPVSIDGRSLTSVIGASPVGGNGDPQEGRGRDLNGLTGLSLSGGQQPEGIRYVAGRHLAPSDAGTGHVLVRYDLMGPPFNLHTGSTIGVKQLVTGRKITLTVVGFYVRPRGRRGFSSFFVAPVYGDRGLATTLAGDDAQSVVSFAVNRSQLTHDAAMLQRDVPGALVVDIGDLTAVVETVLNELLNLLAVITALALGAGLAVVGNGVALAMLERRREIALFKAIGFSPGGVLRFVLVENALAGTLAGAVSVLFVVLVLAIVSHMALQQAIGFDPVVALLVLGGATALAVATAYLAARGPVSIRPIEVLRNE